MVYQRKTKSRRRRQRALSKVYRALSRKATKAYVRKVARGSDYTDPNYVIQLATAKRTNSGEGARQVIAFTGCIATASGGASLIDMWNRFQWVDYNGTTTATHVIAPYTNPTEWLNKGLKMRYKVYQKLEFKNNGGVDLKLMLSDVITRQSVDSAYDIVTTLGYAATDVYDTSAALSLDIPWVPVGPIMKRANDRKEYHFGKLKVMILKPGQTHTHFIRRPWRTLDFDKFYNDNTTKGYDYIAGHTFGTLVMFQGTLGQVTADDLEGDSKVGYMDTGLNVVETYGMKCCYSRGMTQIPGDKIVTNALGTGLEVREFEAPGTKVTGPD